MFNLKLTTKATFSFSKLNKNLEKIINNVRKEGGKDLALKLKDYIKSGKVTPELDKKTINKWRPKLGYNPHYPNLRGNQASKSKPLYATGKLHDSIKAENGKVSFNYYGGLHDEGVIRPQRKWISAMTVKTDSKTLKKIGDDIKKAFKLKRPKTIREVSL